MHSELEYFNSLGGDSDIIDTGHIQAVDNDYFTNYLAATMKYTKKMNPLLADP